MSAERPEVIAVALSGSRFSIGEYAHGKQNSRVRANRAAEQSIKFVTFMKKFSYDAIASVLSP